jgi:vacuolar-type H+-ATPase subunit E/Vma4
LHVSESNPFTGQGVVLVAKSGKVAFNNQVETRLLRYDSEIKRIVFEELQEFENRGLDGLSA